MKKSFGLFGKKQIIFFVLPFIILILMLLLLPDLKKAKESARKMNSLVSSLKSESKPVEVKLKKNLPIKKDEFETYISLLMLQGKDDKAIEIAKKYQKSYPTKTQPYSKLGFLYLTKSYKTKVPSEQNLWKSKAREELTKGTKFLAGENYFEIWDYGRMFEKLEFFEDALSCYKKALVAYKEYDINKDFKYVTPEMKDKVVAEFKSAETLLQQDIERMEKQAGDRANI